MAGISRTELSQAYNGRRVFVTGHTGFKGSWLAVWLRELGASVFGYALAPTTHPSLFEVAGIENCCEHCEADIRDLSTLKGTLARAQPEFIFHLAAQPLVRASYERPLDTVETNVMGTAKLLEAVRELNLRCSIVVITSDKCYENHEWDFGYRETDPMGGHDVYSMSKGAAELVVGSYRRSFFRGERLADHGVALASARAGNVIGGGDWGSDRLVPDIVRALSAGQEVRIRNPYAVRPWQHALEPLGGYLLLGARLAGVGTERPEEFCEAWNFGPMSDGVCTVGQFVDRFMRSWGCGNWIDVSDPAAVHEASLLRLSIDKAVGRLGWSPSWNLETTLIQTIAWYQQFCNGSRGTALLELCRRQIHDYCASSACGTALSVAAPPH